MLNMRDLIPWRAGQPSGRRERETNHPLELLHRDIDRLFEDMWHGLDRPLTGSPWRRRGMDMPRVDVTEDENAFVVSAELPGMDENDVEVTLTDDRLVLKGEKKEERHEEESEGYSYSERSYGRFERSFPVGADIDAEGIAAGFKNGVLTVTLPKTEAAKRTYRKIPINP